MPEAPCIAAIVHVRCIVNSRRSSSILVDRPARAPAGSSSAGLAPRRSDAAVVCMAPSVEARPTSVCPANGGQVAMDDRPDQSRARVQVEPPHAVPKDSQTRYVCASSDVIPLKHDRSAAREGGADPGPLNRTTAEREAPERDATAETRRASLERRQARGSRSSRPRARMLACAARWPFLAPVQTRHGRSTRRS